MGIFGDSSCVGVTSTRAIRLGVDWEGRTDLWTAFLVVFGSEKYSRIMIVLPLQPHAHGL